MTREELREKLLANPVESWARICASVDEPDEYEALLWAAFIHELRAVLLHDLWSTVVGNALMVMEQRDLALEAERRAQHETARLAAELAEARSALIVGSDAARELRAELAEARERMEKAEALIVAFSSFGLSEKSWARIDVEVALTAYGADLIAKGTP